MKVEMTGHDILARIRMASEQADLRAQRRLHGKLDMSGPAIARRIKAASEMLILCRQLAASRSPD
jgi:hypothetical protein